ncbi:MAG: AAA family ATPase [Candidatus Competibacteraceae bacterium]|nr:AAA family ATPase [Candidatus Competibacteraceae bacterium]MCP5134067.1 AAA family ATPase [Gammaproteobacteria bacterium]
MSRAICFILLENLETGITGPHRNLRWLLAASLAGRHVLLEDLLGPGKMALAQAFARSLTLEFQRIQYHPGKTEQQRLAEAAGTWRMRIKSPARAGRTRRTFRVSLKIARVLCE